MTDSEAPTSPLTEATPDSVDELLDLMNRSMVAGMPEAITDDKLVKLIAAYRRQAENWLIQEAEKRAAGPRKRQPKTFDTSQAIDIGDLFQ